jgi:Xaa-Pro aminopeptidase
MKGDIENAVAQGAHALFYPHGLGHMMGLDVHDMEDIAKIMLDMMKLYNAAISLV